MPPSGTLALKLLKIKVWGGTATLASLPSTCFAKLLTEKQCGFPRSLRKLVSEFLLFLLSRCRGGDFLMKPETFFLQGSCPYSIL